ncbi:MAG: methyl-accepting chemotaxis protein [Pseudomonadota bacterium]
MTKKRTNEDPMAWLENQLSDNESSSSANDGRARGKERGGKAERVAVRPNKGTIARRKSISTDSSDIDILESSFKALAPHADELVSRFYEELFKRHPQVRPLFRGVDIAQQKKKLIAALVLVVNNLRKPDTLSRALKELGARHHAYGVMPEYYPFVAETLLDVMSEIAGDLWTDDVSSAWETALNNIANTMINAPHKSAEETSNMTGNVISMLDVMKDVLEHSPINIMIADIDENIVFVNKKARDILTSLEGELAKYLPGFKASEVVGGSIHRYHKDPQAIKNILKAMGPRDKRNGYITPGSFLFEHETRPLYDSNGTKIGYVVQWNDVTKARAEEEQSKKLQKAIDKAQTAIMMIDRDLVITYANESTKELLGKYRRELESLYPRFSVDNIVGTCIDIFHKNPSHQRRLLEDPRNLPYETDIHVGPLIFHIRVNAIHDLSGKYVGNTLEWADVTQLRKKEIEVAQLMSAVEGSTTAMMMCDMNANITYANPAVINLLSKHQGVLREKFPGFDVNKLIGTNIDQFHKNPRHQRNLIADKTRMPYQANIKVAELEFSLTLSAIVDNNGKQLGCALEWKDITEEMDAQRQIERLINNAIDGRLDERIDVANYHGFMKTLGQGVNNMLDAIVTPVQEVKKLLQHLSKNDLTQRMHGQFKGEYQQLQDAINGTMENLSSAISDIAKASKSISVASSEIAQGNTDLSQRTEEQAASLEETASSMEQLTSTVKQNADNARAANQLASSTKEHAEKGGEVVNRAIDAMAEINNSSKKIADIIGVIDEIAFQTNLLALNAAVEAARAGEQGRGFAVVASEVRNLAQRSAAAAKEIKALIKDSVSKVEDGTHLVNESGDTLQEIVGMVKKVSDIIAEIAAASQEQSAGIEQINKAVSHMDEAVQQNAALVEQAAAASESLDEQTHALNVMVKSFDLGDAHGDDDKEPAAVPARKPKAVSTERRAANAKKAAAPKPRPQEASGDDVWEEF